MLRSLYSTALVAAIMIVLVLSVLALAGFPIIDFPPSIDNPIVVDFGARALGPYPTVVGGRMTPINKLAIMGVYLVLLGLIAVVTVAFLIVARGKKRDN